MFFISNHTEKSTGLHQENSDHKYKLQYYIMIRKLFHFKKIKQEQQQKIKQDHKGDATCDRIIL